ncbi:uncharacterized protein LOC130673675 [Microplitis mediator]|uniref:uncharacterized protein LOC130673675 n=1 Tax=Microplitis mediator TaxID=375433 RepID=UPI0025525AA7|nr:uncharacterized protein LOC130673675 [Microplitis mediator]
MNYFYTSSITIWMLIAIVNVSSVTSILVPIQNEDPTEWREHGAEANYAQFNSIHAITINETLLRRDGYCSGKCDSFDTTGMKRAQNLSYPNQCAGSLRSCWLGSESEERKKAQRDYDWAIDVDCSGIRETGSCSVASSQEEQDHYRDILVITGNICKCLCERDDTTHSTPERGDLLDSICFDPVSVEDGYVATGARFKRHGNVMYLELQEGILAQGKIESSTLKWTTSNNCALKHKVIDNFRNDGHYDGLEIILNDLTLTENAVVTGVALGDSLRGRYVDDDGNINKTGPEILKKSQCNGSANDRVHSFWDLLPSTALLMEKNSERSEPCNSKIVFGGTKESSDNIQHVVPFVDLQEVVTDQNSPKPIHGIGWYYRGYPNFGGFLALKLLVKEQ